MIRHQPDDCTRRQLTGQSGTLSARAYNRTQSCRKDMKPKKLSLWSGWLALLMLQPFGLSAEPAFWYRWQSVKTGKYICKQTGPGPGWVKHSGPYLDGGCRVLKQPPPEKAQSAAQSAFTLAAAEMLSMPYGRYCATAQHKHH